MRHEKIIERENGAVIRLVVISMQNVFGPDFRDIFALVKYKDPDTWELFTPRNTFDKNLGGLSVDEYMKRGRKGLLSVVRPHEILKAGMELDEKLRKIKNDACLLYCESPGGNDINFSP